MSLGSRLQIRRWLGPCVGVRRVLSSLPSEDRRSLDLQCITCSSAAWLCSPLLTVLSIARKTWVKAALKPPSISCSSSICSFLFWALLSWALDYGFSWTKPVLLLLYNPHLQH
ncbi:hypothetical protein scyTo_0007803 [Scyliorhinus torazame]|uniref:Uncharacterized protein n=1 Tax=Scyliorhinus torazame TaxID=75743 RepID=A0A401NYF6_SCYTO|nr:hypothetical protein [Scyliorhinus torazame]